MGRLSDIDPEIFYGLYPGQLAADRAATIARLRAALDDFERWTGQSLPPHIAAELQPGDRAEETDQ